jgi:hypothetical protein
MKLDALVRAHGFMKVERPPEMWEADTLDTDLLPLLGEMIAAALVGGSPLSDLTLNVSNVVVEPEETPCEADQGHGPTPGEYVAVTVKGTTDFGPDDSWLPGEAAATGLLGRLRGRLTASGARHAYIRRVPPEGSITAFLPRAYGK